MTPTTDFVGHLVIDPVLHRDEIAYLTLFSRSLAVDRPRDAYATPDQPELPCPWLPSRDGSILTLDGHPECGEAVEWLRYLVGHLLRPRAKAGRRRLPQFEHFTFDHLLQGMVVGCRRETGELVAITAREGRIGTKVLWPADRSVPPREPAPVSRRGRRGPPTGYGDVIDLAARRVRG